MAEYIEREEILDKINEEERPNGDGVYDYYSRIFDIIDIAPAADVALVKHAKWIFQKADDDYSWKPWLCSNCNTAGGKNQTMFCPHCGARMDGD